MTGADLGLPPEDGAAAPPLKEGEFRLLILAQQQGRTWGCVSAAPGATTFDERVPRLTGPDDPLVAVVETLIRLADTRSRRERATILVKQLESVKGVAAVPLVLVARQTSVPSASFTGGAVMPRCVRASGEMATHVSAESGNPRAASVCSLTSKTGFVNPPELAEK